MLSLSGRAWAGIRAVTAATSVCRSLPALKVLVKPDQSPVTSTLNPQSWPDDLVADLAAQTVIAQELLQDFPKDKLMGEEGVKHLDPDTLNRVAELSGRSESQVFDLLNRCSFPGGREESFWTIDPIDGTRGFIRGEQYAICLAYIEKGKVDIGILGCPNLIHTKNGHSCVGTILVAERNKGAFQAPLLQEVSKEWDQIQVSNVDQVENARYVESFESRHSSHEKAMSVAEFLQIANVPTRLDSQCKYAVVARGESEIYMRIPVLKKNKEFIWDHASGSLIVEESGGKVTDLDGKELDFGTGIQLTNNYGIVSSNNGFHDRLLEGIKAIV